MPFNGTGVFSLIYSWPADAAAGIDISSTRMETQETDFATAFDNCITRDGQGQPTANLPMDNFRHTGASNGVAVTDYATMGQLQNSSAISWAVAGGTGDALTAIYAPALTTLVDGQLCFVRATAANTIGNPTFAPNGLTAEVITKLAGVNIGIGEIKGNLHELIFRYNLANTRWEWINPSGFIEAQTGFANTGTPTASSAGSNYAVNDSVTLAGGSFLRPAVMKVATLSGSGIATVTVLDPGLYITFPTNPVAQASTSGTGSGAAFTLTSTGAALISDFSGNRLFPKMGMSTYMDSLMQKTNGLDLSVAIGAANIAAAVQTSLPLPVPQGYLTLTSNTPIITGDVTAATSIFYTPLNGLWTTIHNGSSIVPYLLSGQLPLTFSASQAASNIYDIFLAYNGNSPVIGTGPSWASGTSGSVTAGSCARGSGTGGTALARTQGAWTNAASMSLIWNTGSGNTTITVPANQGIYLGSIFIDGTGGQVSCLNSYGQSRKWGVWNAYNRVPVKLLAGDSTASWTAANITFRPSNNNTANSLTLFSGLAEEQYTLSFHQNLSANIQGSNPMSAIGFNSTTTGSGVQSGTVLNFNSIQNFVAEHDPGVSLGIQVVTSLESAPGSGTTTYSGGITNSRLVARWRA